MTSSDDKPARCFVGGFQVRRPSRAGQSSRCLATASTAWLVAACLATPLVAQTITVVGTRHLTGMEQPPSAEQFAHTLEALSTFEPTQVCVERMSGERIEALVAAPARHGSTFRSDWHGRPLASVIVPTGVSLQLMLERRPADARSEARAFLARWKELETADRVRAIGLLLAGFEFHSAVLNWSWLADAERNEAGRTLGSDIFEALNEALESVHEVYSLGVPLARKAGLHELCTADSQEDETLGMLAARQHGGEPVLSMPQVTARFDELTARSEAAWRPESGASALTAMLRFFNGDEYAEADRRLQWETLREFDNESGPFHRRLMYWHARTAEISAELFRALARSPEERVLLIIGSAHRPFTEADLRAQPWIEVKPAKLLLEVN